MWNSLLLWKSSGPDCSKGGYRYPPDKSLSSGKRLTKQSTLSVDKVVRSLNNRDQVLQACRVAIATIDGLLGSSLNFFTVFLSSHKIRFRYLWCNF